MRREEFVDALTSQNWLWLKIRVAMDTHWLVTKMTFNHPICQGICVIAMGKLVQIRLSKELCI